MRVKELEAENILSLGHINISFGNSGLVLLDGWNHDDNSHNGAGKTGIFNALSFGLYGKLPRKITVSEILRKGCKAGFSRVLMQVGKDEYDVKRSRPNGLQISKNGVLCPDMSQEQLEAVMGLTYEQFLICMYSAQTESVKLITLNDGSKKDFFLRLLSLEDFAERKKFVDSLIKTKTAELSEMELSIGKVDAKIAAYSESLIDEEEIRNQIERLDNSEFNQELVKLAQIPKPDMQKFDKLESSLNAKLREISAAEATINSSRAFLKKIDTSLENLDSGGVECPHCHLPFAMGSDGPKTKQHLLDERASHVDVVNSLTPIVAERTVVVDNLVKVKTKRSESLSKYTEISNRVSELKNSIEMRNRAVTTLNEKLEKQDEIVKKIASARKLLSGLSGKMSALKDEILVYEAVSSALSPTGAPAYVIDSVIDRFNDKVSQYVSLVWPNASYSLQSYKENKSGDIKAKFSDKLAIQGVEIAIGGLSGGELRCLSLAVDFAVVDMVETMFGISINPIILDEGFEGLDSLNRERIVDVLETIALNRQIWVIDHASEVQSRFSRIVRIEKQDGVSKINEDL